MVLKLVDFFRVVHSTFMPYKDNISTLKIWYFFWLTLLLRKRWTVSVGHQYLHSSLKLASCWFLNSFYGLVSRELDFQSRVPCFKTVGLLQSWLSTTPWGSVVKSKLSPDNGSVVLRQWNSIHKNGS